MCLNPNSAEAVRLTVHEVWFFQGGSYHITVLLIDVPAHHTLLWWFITAGFSILCTSNRLHMKKFCFFPFFIKYLGLAPVAKNFNKHVKRFRRVAASEVLPRLWRRHIIWAGNRLREASNTGVLFFFFSYSGKTDADNLFQRRNVLSHRWLRKRWGTLSGNIIPLFSSIVNKTLLSLHVLLQFWYWSTTSKYRPLASVIADKTLWLTFLAVRLQAPPNLAELGSSPFFIFLDLEVWMFWFTCWWYLL